MEKMIIACTCDNNYTAHCGTLLTSIFENNKNRDIEIYILTDYIDEVNRGKFKILADLYNQKINIIDIDIESFKHLPFGGKFENITLATYYRLLIPSVFPQLYNKVLYLDCDIIIRSDLYELWSLNVDNCAFAAVEDALSQIMECPVRLGYDVSELYYNAGVLLYNLVYLREMHFFQKVEAYCRTNLVHIKFHDQDIINALCHGKIQKIPIKWNIMDSFLFREPCIDSDYRKELDNALQNPNIIHYTGVLKPWFKECNHPYKSEYWYYRCLSPWKDGKEVNKYTGIKLIAVRMKYLIKMYLLSRTRIGKTLYRK